MAPRGLLLKGIIRNMSPQPLAANHGLALLASIQEVVMAVPASQALAARR